MREQFEKLPSIAEILKYNEKSYFDEATGEYVSQYSYLSGYLNGAWQVWQAAKAQAVPEPSIDLTGHDIKYITNFMCYEDQDNLDTEVTIQKCKSGFEGAGLYAWVAEYPEEGGIKISANSQEQNQ